MGKIERKYLVGLFFIMTGVFMPWLRLMEYQYGTTRLFATASVSGHNLVVGWVIFIIALTMVSLFFLKLPYKDETRMLAAHKFFIAFIFALLVIGGFIPPLVEQLVNPHVGLLAIIIGCTLSYKNLDAVKII